MATMHDLQQSLQGQRAPLTLQCLHDPCPHQGRVDHRSSVRGLHQPKRVGHLPRSLCPGLRELRQQPPLSLHSRLKGQEQGSSYLPVVSGHLQLNHDLAHRYLLHRSHPHRSTLAQRPCNHPYQPGHLSSDLPPSRLRPASRFLLFLPTYNSPPRTLLLPMHLVRHRLTWISRGCPAQAIASSLRILVRLSLGSTRIYPPVQG